jgi:hypothetical protein
MLRSIAASGNPLTWTAVDLNSSWPAANATAFRKRKKNSTAVMPSGTYLPLVGRCARRYRLLIVDDCVLQTQSCDGAAVHLLRRL